VKSQEKSVSCPSLSAVLTACPQEERKDDRRLVMRTAKMKGKKHEFLRELFYLFFKFYFLKLFLVFQISNKKLFPAIKNEESRTRSFRNFCFCPARKFQHPKTLSLRPVKEKDDYVTNSGSKITRKPLKNSPTRTCCLFLYWHLWTVKNW